MPMNDIIFNYIIIISQYYYSHATIIINKMHIIYGVTFVNYVLLYMYVLIYHVISCMYVYVYHNLVITGYVA